MLNSWSRFTFALPFATFALVAVSRQPNEISLPAIFFFYCAVTAVAQLVANVCLIAAFRAGSFGEAIVFHKLEVVMTAIAGALIFGERPGLFGALGIVACALGVIQINLARANSSGGVRGLFHFGHAGALALACAALIVVASFALKLANTSISTANPGLPVGGIGAPIRTLFHTTWMEVVILSGWLVWYEPKSLRAVPRYVGRMLGVGSTGFLASLGWFWSYSLTLVAYAKAVGQIEALIAVALGVRLLGERGLLRQLPGILLVTLGIVLVLFD